MLDNFKKRLMFSTGIFFLAILVLGSAILFVSTSIKNNERFISNSQKKLSERSRDIERLFSLRTQAEETKPMLERLSAALPTKDRLLFLGTEIKTIGRKYSLSGVDLKFGEESVIQDRLNSVKFNITTDGEYRNLMSFISSLEGTGYLLNISSVDIQKQGDKYRAIIEGSIFFRSQNAQQEIQKD